MVYWSSLIGLWWYIRGLTPLGQSHKPTLPWLAVFKINLDLGLFWGNFNQCTSQPAPPPPSAALSVDTLSVKSSMKGRGLAHRALPKCLANVTGGLRGVQTGSAPGQLQKTLKGHDDFSSGGEILYVEGGYRYLSGLPCVCSDSTLSQLAELSQTVFSIYSIISNIRAWRLVY